MNTLNDCDAYLKQLQAEHHRLNFAVLEIRHKLEGLDPTSEAGAKLDSLINDLESLLTQLKNHFREEEEEEGFLEEAVTRCRSVQPDAKALMGQHPQLVETLDRLILGLKSGTIDGNTCRQLFDSFEQQIKAHECGENTLLQFALGGNAADYDAEGNE